MEKKYMAIFVIILIVQITLIYSLYKLNKSVSDIAEKQSILDFVITDVFNRAYSREKVEKSMSDNTESELPECATESDNIGDELIMEEYAEQV